MTGLFLVLLGAGIGYYFYSQKVTKESTIPTLEPTGEIKYPSSITTPLKQKTEATYNPDTNQIRIQPRPIQKKGIILVPNPITIDINKILARKSKSKPSPAPKTQSKTPIEQLLEEEAKKWII